MSLVHVVIDEAEPGIVHFTTEAIHDLLTQAGWRKLDPTNGGDFEYVRNVEPKSTARPPHPATMIGRK